jgi:hypothetical protein
LAFTPLEGWTITEKDSFIEAFFSYGPGGHPFDLVQAQPPESLFEAGRTYAYEGGVGNGAFAWVQAVPQPPTLILCLAAFTAWLVVRIRKNSRVTMNQA